VFSGKVCAIVLFVKVKRLNVRVLNKAQNIHSYTLIYYYYF